MLTMPSPQLLRSCLDVLHYSGINRLLSRRSRGRGIILCLHSVVPGGGNADGFRPNSQLEISPEFLDGALFFIKRAGYRLISLTDALAELHIERPNAAPFAVLTLDDGYRDNAAFAAPVFRKHDCPYTVYVTPGFADGTCELWWKVLEQGIASNASISLPAPAGTDSVSTATLAEKHSAWNRLSPQVADMPEYEQRIWIRRFATLNGGDPEAQCKSLTMTWDELRALSADPLCTIGAHTMKHFRLSRLSTSEMMREIRESVTRIEQELGQPVRHFAYPYGDIEHAGPREFEAAAKLGLHTAVTTRKGVVFSEHRLHRYALPRVMMSGRYQKLRYLEALMSGVPLALLNRFRRINVDQDQASTST